jgi:plastocyanin
MSRARFFLGFLGTVVLSGCGSDSTDINPPGGRPLPSNGVRIVVGAQSKGGAAFTPNPLTIALGDGGVVKWFNDDQTSSGYDVTGTTHNIMADDGAFASGNIPPGSTFEGTFGAAGTFGYHCGIHPTMKGTVTVTP